MVEVLISKRAAKDLKPLSPVMKRRIRDAVIKLGDWPETLADVKKLQGRDGYRMRVGQYRLLFDLRSDGKLRIDRILPRGEAYD